MMSRETFVTKLGLSIALMDHMSTEVKEVLWNCILAIYHEGDYDTLIIELEKLSPTEPTIDMVTKLIRNSTEVSPSVNSTMQGTGMCNNTDKPTQGINDTIITDDAKWTQTVYEPVIKPEGNDRALMKIVDEYVDLIIELRPTPPTLIEQKRLNGSDDSNNSHNILMDKIINTCIDNGNWNINGLRSLSEMELDTIISMCPLPSWVYTTSISNDIDVDDDNMGEPSTPSK